MPSVGNDVSMPARGVGYLPALDGLRGVSIALVVLAHAGLGRIVPGGLGVTVFFFISGYIITRLMLAEHAAHGAIGIRAFYLRRFFRLMPALYAYLAVCTLVLWMAAQPPRWQDIAAVVFYVGNYWNIYGHFQSGSIPSPLPITWSLAVEEHYYLVYPLLFALLAARPARLLGVILAVLAVVLAWRVWLTFGIGLERLRPDRIYMATDTRVDSILYGAGFAVLGQLRPAWLERARHPAFLVLGLGLLAASLLYRNPEFREAFRYSMQGIALACMWQGLLFGGSWPSRWLSSPLMLYIGRISYSLYLYHWLVTVLLQAWLPALGTPARVALTLALSLPAAHASWRWVERGGLVLRDRLMPASSRRPH